MIPKNLRAAAIIAFPAPGKWLSRFDCGLVVLAEIFLCYVVAAFDALCQQILILIFAVKLLRRSNVIIAAAFFFASLKSSYFFVFQPHYKAMKASKFKNNAAKKSLEDWIDFYVAKSDLDYQKLDVFTSYGSTRLLSINHEKQELKPILFIPGARTCGIFWDLNNHLHLLGDNYRIYLLDVLGQPGLSDGACLKVKDESFGLWLREVCREIRFKKGICVGASFGGELIIKLAAVAPGKIEKAVLMNPIGFSYINLNPKNLYYTLLPVYFPTRKNIEKFFNRIVFTPEMRVPAETLEKVCDFTENILKFFEFNAEYPYKMQDDELKKLRAETHLFVGAKDALIPQNKTIERARKLLPNLKSVEVFPQTGHGIELSTDAILKLKAVLAN